MILTFTPETILTTTDNDQNNLGYSTVLYCSKVKNKKDSKIL